MYDVRGRMFVACSVNQAAISGQGCPEKSDSRPDGEYRTVASLVIILPEYLENPFDEADNSGDPLCRLPFQS